MKNSRTVIGFTGLLERPSEPRLRLLARPGRQVAPGSLITSLNSDRRFAQPKACAEKGAGPTIFLEFDLGNR